MSTRMRWQVGDEVQIRRGSSDAICFGVLLKRLGNKPRLEGGHWEIQCHNGGGVVRRWRWEIVNLTLAEDAT